MVTHICTWYAITTKEKLAIKTHFLAPCSETPEANVSTFAQQLDRHQVEWEDHGVMVTNDDKADHFMAQMYRSLGNDWWIDFVIVLSWPPDVRSKIQEHHANGNLIPFCVMFFNFFSFTLCRLYHNSKVEDLSNIVVFILHTYLYAKNIM